MPINIGQVGLNQGNFGGLGSLAGTRVGNLGLQSPAEAFLKARGQNLQHDIQQRQLGQQSIQNFAEGQRQDKQFAQQQANLDRNFGLDQQRLQADIKAKQEQSEMAKKQFELEMNKHAMDIAKMEDGKKLQASQLFSFNAAQLNEKEWNDNKVGIINAGVKSGLLTEDQGKQFIGMNHRDMNRYAKTMAYVTGRAKDYQSVMGSQGGMKVYDEQGQLRYETTGAEKPVRSGIQKDMQGTEESLLRIKTLAKNFDPSYVGGGGALKGETYNWRDYLSNVPGVGPYVKLDPKQVDWTQKRSGYISEVTGNTFAYIKSVSGVAFSDKERKAMMPVMPNADDGPAAFTGKMDNLSKNLENLQGLRGQMLREGFELNSADYKHEYLNRASRILKTGLSSNTETANQPPQGKVATEAGIQETLQKNPNMTREQLINTLQKNGYTIEGGQ